ncbi:MAG: sigma 54-interacting transcriptional regulator, partial [Deltaproteobacteria bacterium]|nr:sigma 54-interacting transcriptional regulator [Deltaproteobacteria bacterium]
MGNQQRDRQTEVLFCDGTATLRKYALRSVGSDAEPRVAEVGPGSLSVGQSEANDIRVRDPSVSRFHFELVRRADGLLIRDLGSTNGTLVEGVFVHEAKISPGQRIRVGRAEFIVETEREPRRVDAHPQARLGALVGGSLPMRILYAQIERAARSDATVLLLGESGTGKELVAQEIHDHSARQRAPMVIVDCGALPEDL